MRKLARQTGIARESDWIMAKEELKRYVLKQEQLLTDENKRVQRERCRKFLKKAETADWDRILFTDEILFSLEQPYYEQNDGICSKSHDASFPWFNIIKISNLPYCRQEFVQQATLLNLR